MTHLEHLISMGQDMDKDEKNYIKIAKEEKGIQDGLDVDENEDSLPEPEIVEI
eukprot:CAMPEP_0205800214 /NCGR_PEP_ID=MMETSP0205-20121125/1797_1 /ASSEMBLY_ACC=CAM_ASM_000278 /TAXON_ID=36767 /ORGANISM="Euplotes focardii, Strain TN1" /LENGTH=52 /DNA_ID=CAMNT_0053062927 /DNA_START=143 /DNA_END=298 /DNA_ORIENTATION=+